MRLLIFPMSVKSQKNQASISALNPKLEKLKKQYANNPQKLQEAQAALYAEENVNPMASCLPLMIQFPLLYGIIDVVYRPLTHIVRIKSDIIDRAVEICKNIEEYAEKTLGLMPLNQSQIEYIQLQTEDEVTISEPEDNFFVSINDYLVSIWEYLRGK